MKIVYQVDIMDKKEIKIIKNSLNIKQQALQIKCEVLVLLVINKK